MQTEGITLNGFKELEEALQVLGDKVAKRVLRSAAQAGASRLKKIISDGAPVSTIQRKKVFGGHKYDYLKKHLRQQIKTTVVKAVEADVKILVHTSDAFWGRFVEKGTKRGIEAKHWMQHAFEGSEAQVVEAVEAKLVQAIIRETGK
jgi:HK97 gp10 family phage protein